MLYLKNQMWDLFSTERRGFPGMLWKWRQRGKATILVSDHQQLDMAHLSSSCENPDLFYLWSQNPPGLKPSSPMMSIPTTTEIKKYNTPKNHLDGCLISFAWFCQFHLFPIELPAIPAAP